MVNYQNIQQFGERYLELGDSGFCSNSAGCLVYLVLLDFEIRVSFCHHYDTIFDISEE